MGKIGELSKIDFFTARPRAAFGIEFIRIAATQKNPNLKTRDSNDSMKVRVHESRNRSTPTLYVRHFTCVLVHGF